MIYNRSGQFFWITYLVIAGIFFMFWALFFGGFLNVAGAESVTSSGATGLEAFFLSNMNIVILFAFMLSIFSVIYFGGGR